MSLCLTEKFCSDSKRGWTDINNIFYLSNLKVKVRQRSQKYVKCCIEDHGLLI